ncbi:MAG: ABC transporter substrate-binding protein [Chloroflexota bacterium]|nr:ABC transporter substrate-binding protein [Chloroflexota bacterium]
MMFKKFLASAIIAVLFLPILAACGDNTTAPTTVAASKSAATTAAVSGAVTTTTSATTGATTGKQAVTLALSYIPDVQFAPYYVAQDKGYFAAEGLDVTFQYGTINDLMALVGQGKIPFALAGGDEVLQARAGGIPVTYIATQYQKYPVALASPKSKGITKLADLKGKTIGIPGQYGSSYVGLKAILAAAKLTEEDIKEQVIGFNQREALTQGKVDAAMVFSMNEPVQLQKAGVALDIIEVSSVSNLASVGLITGESLIKSNPELVQKITRAVTRGLKDTIANPDAAFDSTVKVAPDAKGADPELQRAVLKETVKFMVAENVKGQPIGYSDPKVWETSQQFLLDNKLIQSKVDSTIAFSNKFVSADIGKY